MGEGQKRKLPLSGAEKGKNKVNTYTSIYFKICRSDKIYPTVCKELLEVTADLLAIISENS